MPKSFQKSVGSLPCVTFSISAVDFRSFLLTFSATSLPKKKILPIKYLYLIAFFIKIGFSHGNEKLTGYQPGF